jgi:hypothetical protein
MDSTQTRDLTDRYHVPKYQRGEASGWLVDRAEHPVQAIVVHHTAGWYGRTLTAAAIEAREVEQIDALAADHRKRFGVGPGYHYVAFPSGRLYAVGKWGTHRAHTTGRSTETREYWNMDAIGICAFGDYEVDTPTPYLVEAMKRAVSETRQFANAHVSMHAHGTAPTVNSMGAPQPQATACPGRLLLARFAEIDIPPPMSITDAVIGELETARTRIQAALVMLSVRI